MTRLDVTPTILYYAEHTQQAKHDTLAYNTI